MEQNPLKRKETQRLLIILGAVLVAVVLIVIVICKLGGPSAAPTITYAEAPPVASQQIELTTTTEEPEQLVQSDDWRLALVNKEYKLPEDLDISLTTLSNGRKVDERMYPDLQEMFDTMRAEGVYPVVSDGYRTEEEQQAVMDEKIEEFKEDGSSQEEAEAKAADYVAEPGYSEHQLGLALDINADTAYSDNETVYNWLQEHAADYGFILRYPEGKEDITGIAYEPWHYRYVGKEAAKEITDEGLCLEEYLTAQSQ